MNLFDQHIKNCLEQRDSTALYRKRAVRENAQGTEIYINGKSYLNFCSNDYLGLANHPALVTAFKNAVDCYGIGSSASPLLSGYSKIHQQLEEELADFLGYPKVLLFSSGYAANMGVITALAKTGDYILQDRLNHASLLDGAQLTKAYCYRYRHSDLQHLQAKLEQIQTNKVLVISDGVFSTNGDIANLTELTRLAARHNTKLMIDDAHGIGVLGKTGRGCIEYFNCAYPQVPILTGTFGKAFGTAGAFVAGGEELIEYLIQFARSYIYSTAQPAAVAAANLAALKIIKTESWRRDHLRELIAYMQQRAKQLDLPLTLTSTPIQTLVIRNIVKASALHKTLLQHGLWIGLLRPPTVPDNSTCLRITLSATHTFKQLDKLLMGLVEIFSS